MASRCEDGTVTGDFLDLLPNFQIDAFSKLEEHSGRFAEKKSCVLCRNFISIYKINRTLHGRLGIRILSSRAESISHSFTSLTLERYFQHSKIKFVSPLGHVISSIYAKTAEFALLLSSVFLLVCTFDINCSDIAKHLPNLVDASSGFEELACRGNG